MRRAWMLAPAFCGMAAAPAHAGQVEVYDDGSFAFVVEYSGLPGEANRVTASYDRASGTFALTDRGAIAMVPRVHTGMTGVDSVSGCTYETRRVVCRHEGPREYDDSHFWLEDGNDSVSFTSPSGATLVGGPGNDTLAMNGGPATIVGGEGHDLLRGGDSDDDLLGGPGGDRVDGGAGTDRATYDSMAFSVRHDEWPGMSATAGVRVTLDGLPGDGTPGEGDNVLPTIERLFTTHFDDVVTGSEGPDFLVTYSGDDEITGAGGEDVVWAGAGDDSLALADGEADAYHCDAGVDVLTADASDVPAWTGHPAGCETETITP